MSENRVQEIGQLLAIHRTSGVDYVRIGQEFDGGYVLANDISQDDFLISAGIGDDDIWLLSEAAFEKDMSPLCKGMDLYECAVDSMPGLPKNARFYRGFVGSDFLLQDMIERTGHDGDFILKVDIEGGEWGLFSKASTDEIAKFRQIVVEFHNIPDHIRDNFEMIYSVFSKLFKTHRIVLISPNNYGEAEQYGSDLVPQYIEVLLLRRDSYNFPKIDFPESLLTRCSEQLPHLEMFYRNSSPKTIPKILLQTSKQKPTVEEQRLITKHFPSWEYRHFDDREARQYIRGNKIDGLPNPKERYLLYRNGAHRADFFRYWFLYINGGCFLDSDAVVFTDFGDLLSEYDIVSCKSCLTLPIGNVIYQGLLLVKPRNETIFKALKSMYELEDLQECNSGSVEGFLSICRRFETLLHLSSNVKLFEERPIEYTSPSDGQRYIGYKILESEDELVAIHYQQEKIIHDKDDLGI